MSDKKVGVESMALSMAGLVTSKQYSTGYLAVLRRLDPTDPGSWSEPAVQRLLAQVLPDEWSGQKVTQDWGLLAHLLAIAAPNNFINGDPMLGKALQTAEYSESRLLRLLHADRRTLDVLLPRAVRFLTVKEQRVAPVELIRFIRSTSADDQKSAKQARLEIARAYYRAERDASKNSTATKAEVA